LRGSGNVLVASPHFVISTLPQISFVLPLNELVSSRARIGLDRVFGPVDEKQIRHDDQQSATAITLGTPRHNDHDKQMCCIALP
jgi:hypothetical protein